jgi:hypothetical protein
MSDYISNERSNVRGEVERDSLLQSALGYYASGPQHGPEPSPTAWEAGNDLPDGSGLRVALLVAVGLIVAVIRRVA